MGPYGDGPQPVQLRAHPTLPSQGWPGPLWAPWGAGQRGCGRFPISWPAGKGYGTCSKALPLLRLRIAHPSSDHWCRGCALTAQQPGVSPSPEAMRDKRCPHLTSSMNLSLGASLTSSSLMAKIWSPGRSLSSEGPPARREGQGQPRHPGAAGWRVKQEGPKHPQSICPPMWRLRRTPCRPARGDRRGQEPREGCRSRGKRRCVSWQAAAVSRTNPTSYLLPPTAPPPASRCQPQSRIRRGGGAGPSPVGACPKAAAHIPYHRHRAPPASHGCAASTGTRL